MEPIDLRGVAAVVAIVAIGLLQHQSVARPNGIAKLVEPLEDGHGLFRCPGSRDVELAHGITLGVRRNVSVGVSGREPRCVPEPL